MATIANKQQLWQSRIEECQNLSRNVSFSSVANIPAFNETGQDYILWLRIITNCIWKYLPPKNIYTQEIRINL